MVANDRQSKSTRADLSLELSVPVSFLLHEVALGPSAIEHIEVLHKVGESKVQLSTTKR